MLRSTAVKTLLALLTFFLLWRLIFPADEGEGISDLPDVAIPHTSWRIQNRIMGHPSPLGGSGWLDVIARNKDTGEKIVILSLSDIQAEVTESVDERNRVIITLPKETEILEKHDSFGPVSIIYRFKE